MAWTYSNWMTAATAYAVAGVSTSAKTFTVAGDARAFVAPGDRIAVTGSTGNNGTYTVSSVSYAPNSTTITVEVAPANATPDGSIALGPSARTQLANLRLHHAEVAARISESVQSTGTSINTADIRQYLADIVMPELRRLERAAGGILTRGRLSFK